MKRYKVGELAEIRRGMSLLGKYYAREGVFIRLTLGNFDYKNNSFKINTSKDNLYYTGEIPEEFILNQGDIITPLTEQTPGLLGSTARIPESGKYVLSQDIAVIKSKDILDCNFSFYLFSSAIIKKQLASSAQQTKIRHTSPDKIRNCVVFIPELGEQQRIAKILSTIDAKIELNKKISRELEAMAKELYDYWFVQFEFPNEQGKPYKSSGGKMVWNKTLKREIPEGWEVGKLGDCLEHINTGLNPRDNFKLGNGNIKYVTVKNIAMDGSIDFSGCDYVNEEARKMIHARSKISKGDILFASISPLGRCFILHEEPKDWDINESVFSIRPRSIINSEYLYEYFRSEWFIKKSEKVATGSIFSGIRIQVLTSLPILIPDKSIIGDFSTKLSNLLCQKEKFSQENMILTNLRNQLLPLLMNGQVRVTEEKVSSVSQKDNTNRFVLWKNTYPVAARGEKNDTVLRAMYEAMDDEDK